MKAETWRDLIAYRTAFELQQSIFEVSKGFPREEVFALIDQIRRSSRSVGANISEAWRKRRYEAHFVSKLTDADAENAETQHWVDTALACGYLTQEQRDGLISTSEEVGRLLGSLIQSASQWCPSAH